MNCTVDDRQKRQRIDYMIPSFDSRESLGNAYTRSMHFDVIMISEAEHWSKKDAFGLLTMVLDGWHYYYLPVTNGEEAWRVGKAMRYCNLLKRNNVTLYYNVGGMGISLMRRILRGEYLSSITT